MFLYRFDTSPHLVQGWTSDRKRITEALQALRPDGATALYDAVAQALPLLDAGQARQEGAAGDLGRQRHQQPDHASTRCAGRFASRTPWSTPSPSTQRSRRTVPAATAVRRDCSSAAVRGRFRFRFPAAGIRRERRRYPACRPASTPRPPLAPEPEEPRDLGAKALREPVNLDALRQITDDSGGFTELVRDPRDLNPTTGRIADELGKQVLSGVPEPGCPRRPLACHPCRGSRQRAPGTGPPRLSRTAVVLLGPRTATRCPTPTPTRTATRTPRPTSRRGSWPRRSIATLAFVIVEAVCGWWADSLALLSDAGHNLADAAALGLSWYALWIAEQGRRTRA